MDSDVKRQKLTGQQQRVLKLLFKFRFVSAGLLADVMGIRRVSVYEVLEQLVSKDLVTKVYESKFRIDRRPAYYYLNKSGVTAVRKLMDVKESVVHALYKNDEMTDDFVSHSMKLMQCYKAIIKYLPKDSAVFSKTEINRFRQFPKNRPDLYIRTPSGQEAIVVIADDKPPYIVRKRLDEIITHSEDESWEGDNYPLICFVLKDTAAKYSFLFTTKKKLESIGMDEGELLILATALTAFDKPAMQIWSSPLNPKGFVSLFE
jgi:DNA-binding MarR family transcriptional regulator